MENLQDMLNDAINESKASIFFVVGKLYGDDVTYLVRANDDAEALQIVTNEGVKGSTQVYNIDDIIDHGKNGVICCSLFTSKLNK